MGFTPGCDAKEMSKRISHARILETERSNLKFNMRWRLGLGAA
jgi:hypothetical protein